MMAEHPDRERVMALLDGELAAPLEAEVHAHLKACETCRAFADELGSVSRNLAAWRVEPAPVSLDRGMAGAIAAALRQRAPRSRPWQSWRWYVPRRSWTFVGAAALVGLALAIALPQVRRSPARVPRMDAAAVPRTVAGRPAAVDALTIAEKGNERPRAFLGGRQPADASGGLLVARTAAIHVVVANVDLARADLTRFLAAHRGYISHLDLSGEPPASRVLTVTVKVPSAELEATLTALRGFGRVVNETQGSEDVTAQSVDLDARLSNARRTEQRLAAVLDGRQGRVADILEVEREIARVRGEIEQMEAERTRLTGRVDFAAVDLRIEEERRAGLAPSRPPFTRELANAAVDGYQAAVSVVTGFLLLVLRLAPTLLLFGILLLWPLRAAWRRATRLRVRQLPS
ncbi:MAG: hypothetical protein A3G21_14290 [Acidobacteria bacterium RIFCSPLOWO2_12_FULL_66_21]|nr:MAG: hypothetical protein A3G21_14290 [Acidobacteria bacterium RIFCSPLOWO2_12_FULL_66_21]